MKPLVLASAIAILAGIAPAQAATFTLDFGALPVGGALCTVNCVKAASGLLDVSDGVRVEGFSNTDHPAFVTQKPNTVNAADERGLGQSNTAASPSDSTFEVAPGRFLVIDNVVAESLGFTPQSFTIGSLQAGERMQVFGYTGPDGGSNDLIPGDLKLITTLTGLPSIQSVAVSGFDKYAFGAISQTGRTLSDFTVINETLSAVPEPSTWAMGLLGFGVLTLLGLRKARPARSLLA